MLCVHLLPLCRHLGPRWARTGWKSAGPSHLPEGMAPDPRGTFLLLHSRWVPAGPLWPGWLPQGLLGSGVGPAEAEVKLGMSPVTGGALLSW